MSPALWVALGGALGAVARFKLGGWVTFNYPGWTFPLATFLVNVLGCLLVGILAGASERPGLLSPEARLFLVTGILGGFTTFSAFGVETFALVRRGEVLIAGSYAGLSVALSLFAVYAGFTVARLLSR